MIKKFKRPESDWIIAELLEYEAEKGLEKIKEINEAFKEIEE